MRVVRPRSLRDRVLFIGRMVPFFDWIYGDTGGRHSTIEAVWRLVQFPIYSRIVPVLVGPVQSLLLEENR